LNWVRFRTFDRRSIEVDLGSSACKGLGTGMWMFAKDKWWLLKCPGEVGKVEFDWFSGWKGGGVVGGCVVWRSM